MQYSSSILLTDTQMLRSSENGIHVAMTSKTFNQVVHVVACLSVNVEQQWLSSEANSTHRRNADSNMLVFTY